MKLSFCKKIIISIIVTAAFSVSAGVSAQTKTEGESDIPENLRPLAQDLGCDNRNECEQAFEVNFEKGLELAEKHKVYGEEQSKIAQSFKQEVIAKISSLSDKNFEEEMVKIAQEILKKPTVAKTLQVDKESVRAAETIITEVKSAGTNIDVCSRPADSLSREELIACLEASKNLTRQSKIVGKYIPKGVKEKMETLDSVISLDQSLARGEYAELGKTAEEVGQKCLRQGSESLTACDEIAQKYFGPEGAKELAAARSNAKQAGDFYLQGLENLELRTPDGRKITGKEAIRKSCDNAFTARDVKLARACGEFAVKNGFTNREEIEESLKIFESFASKPQVNFDQCRLNPESCREFIPEEFKKGFESEIKIQEIMKAEMGFDPIECEKSSFNFEIGKKCFEASKKALPKLKELSQTYPEALRIVSEIEFGIKREGLQIQRNQALDKTFEARGGPGGCKSEQECFAYCSDPVHGAECISFGAKNEIFQGVEAVERYQKYNNALNVSTPFFSEPYQGGLPGNYNNQQGGTGNGSGPYQNNFRQVPPPPFYNEGNFGGPVGPSPECFAAIQSGDFVKAKEICNAPVNAYQYRSQEDYRPYVSPNRGICPAIPNIPCPTGTRRVDRVTPEGCGIYECVVDNYESRCSSDQYWKVTSAGGQGYCAPKESYSSYSYDPKERCYREGGTWTSDYCKYPDYNQRSSYSYSSSNYQDTASCPNNLLNLLGSGCHYMHNDNSGNRIYCNGEMTKSAKYGDASVVDGCSSPNTGNYSSYATPYGQREQIWNSKGLRSWVRTDADTNRIARLKEACAGVPSSSSNIWMSGAGNSGSADFGMPDEAKCRAWTSGSQSSYSSYSYSSTYTTADCSKHGSGWHSMDSSGACFDNGMYSYKPAGATAGDPPRACSGYDSPIAGCRTSSGSGSSGGYSSYSYSSYNYTPPSGQREQVWNPYGLRSWIRTDADTARIERLKQACASVTSSSYDIWMPGAGNSGSVDFGMPDESRCKAWSPSSQTSYSSYGGGGYSSYGSYSSYSYSSYGYSQCDWSTQYYKSSNQTCMPKTDCYNTANADYNSSECQGVRNTTSGGGYSSSYGGYSYSSTSACPTSLLGSGCHDMGNAYFNGAMDQYVNYGGSTVKNCTTEYLSGCTSWSNNSSYSTGAAYSSYSTGGSYSSYSTGGNYSSAYDASAACAQSGGSWNGSSCVIPNTVSSAATYSSATAPDPSAACAQAGGTWDGTTCVMPGSATLNKNSSLMASLSQILKGIFEVFLQ